MFALLQVSLWAQMGLRWEGLLPALVVPLFLTFILFLGPLVQSHLSVPVTATLRMYMGTFDRFGMISLKIQNVTLNCFSIYISSQQCHMGWPKQNTTHSFTSFKLLAPMLPSGKGVS